MGPTSSIPHGKSLPCETCSHWLNISAVGVEGVAGFIVEGSPPSPSEYGGMVSGDIRSYPLEEVNVKVAALVADTISIRVACFL